MKYKITRANSDYEIIIELNIKKESIKMGLDNDDSQMLNMLENEIDVINAIADGLLNDSHT